MSEEKSQALTETLRAKGVPRACQGRPLGHLVVGLVGSFWRLPRSQKLGLCTAADQAPKRQRILATKNMSYVVMVCHGMSWSQVFGVELKHCDIL